MPPVQTTPPAPAPAPAPSIPPVMTPPPPAPVVAPSPAPVVPPAQKVPVQIEPMMPKTPMTPTEAHHHPNVALISFISILIGLIAGAAGGFYGKDYVMQFLPGAAAPAAQEQMQQAAQQAAAAEQQVQAEATASSYSEVDTNPLGDVQTNPF